MIVTETFFVIGVADMTRATAFYVRAFGAEVAFAMPIFSSLHVAGVRIGLAHDPAHVPARIGVHFAIRGSDVAAGLDEIVSAGGTIVEPPTEIVPGVL